MLFTTAKEKFIQYLETKDYSDATINGYGKELRYFNNWLEKEFNGPVYLDEINTQILEDYLLYRKKKGDSTASRSRIAYIFKSFYKFAARKDLGKNIALDLEAVKVRRKERQYLTAQEIDKVLAEISKPLIKIVTLFLYHTGCRISDALKLKISSGLDFENDVIHFLSSKGNKDYDVPLSSKLRQALLDYLENVRPEVGTDYVFATERSGSLSRVYYNRELKQAVKEAGISKEITAHCIRHSTAVRLCREQSVDLATVRDLLNHESLIRIPTAAGNHWMSTCEGRGFATMVRTMFQMSLKKRVLFPRMLPQKKLLSFPYSTVRRILEQLPNRQGLVTIVS
jgi:integrase/recombinase XerD